MPDLEKELQQLKAKVEDLENEVVRLSAAVYHPSDRVHEIIRLMKAGRHEEAKALRLRRPYKKKL